MPWTKTARREYVRRTQRYSSDLTDREWSALAFSRTGAPDSGGFGDADVIAAHRVVDTGALQG